MLSISTITKNIFKYNKNSTNNYWLYFYTKFFSFSNVFIFLFLNIKKKSLVKKISKSSLSSELKLYFIKHESFYTKLKYSRVPQFDTSSGATASFISGMYGFLVCEKFGFELIDSGDFLFLLIYLILYYFLGLLVLSILNSTSNILNILLIILKSFKN